MDQSSSAHSPLPYDAPLAPPPPAPAVWSGTAFWWYAALCGAALLVVSVEAMVQLRAADDPWGAIMLAGLCFGGVVGLIVGVVLHERRGIVPGLAAGAVFGALAMPIGVYGANLGLAAGLFGGLIIVAAIARRWALH